MFQRYPKAFHQRMNLDPRGRLKILLSLRIRERSKLHKSKDAFQDGKKVPTDDRGKRILRSRSGRLPIGKDHRCTTTHQVKLLPRWGKSVDQLHWSLVLLHQRRCCYRIIKNLLQAHGYHRYIYLRRHII